MNMSSNPYIFYILDSIDMYLLNDWCICMIVLMVIVINLKLKDQLLYASSRKLYRPFYFTSLKHCFVLFLIFKYFLLYNEQKLTCIIKIIMHASVILCYIFL